MKKNILITVFLVFPLICFAQNAKTKTGSRSVKPSLELLAKSDKEVYRIGENIVINLEFRNNSDSVITLKFDRPGLYAFFTFKIYRNEEELKPYRYFDLKDMVFPIIETKVASGSFYNMKVIINKLDWVDKHKAMFEKPGIYKIIVTYGFMKDTMTIGINSNPVVIEVMKKK